MAKLTREQVKAVIEAPIGRPGWLYTRMARALLAAWDSDGRCEAHGDVGAEAGCAACHRVRIAELEVGQDRYRTAAQALLAFHDAGPTPTYADVAREQELLDALRAALAGEG